MSRAPVALLVSAPARRDPLQEPCPCLKYNCYTIVIRLYFYRSKRSTYLLLFSRHTVILELYGYTLHEKGCTMPRKPTGQPPLKALAVKLPAPLIAEIRRYADHHRTTISKVLLEGVELRLHGVQSPSQAPGNSPIPAPTLATVTQIAATLTTAADQLRRLCQSPTVPETGQQLSTPTLSVPTGNPAYNGNTPLGEDTYNGNTSQTPAREPTTESAAKE